jgi:hypothetical protein
MNRASVAYVVVCTVFALGIWAILEVGTAFLTAPRDLDGRWKAENAPEAPGFSISQSGKFVRFSMGEGGGHFDAVLTETRQATAGAANDLLRFDGDGWHVEGVGATASDAVRFTFRAPDGIQAPRSGTYLHERMNSEAPPPSATSKQGAHS